MAGSPTSRNLIAVIIGAVLLFGAISVLPIVIMRRHRRRATESHANELRALQVNGCMRQVTVQRWLDQQRPTPNIIEQYAGESCPICLTSLLAPSTLAASASISMSSSTVQTLPQCQQHIPPCPSPPETAHIAYPHSHSEPCIPSTNNDDESTGPGSRSHWNLHLSRGPSCETRSHTNTSTDASGSFGHRGVLILTRCNHVFHTACLASWFEYLRVQSRAQCQYRCPVCKDLLGST
ncbi:hypothetical protein BDW60DRAFT_105791 [Aspergillus nidulans var. acristatus]